MTFVATRSTLLIRSDSMATGEFREASTSCLYHGNRHSGQKSISVVAVRGFRSIIASRRKL